MSGPDPRIDALLAAYAETPDQLLDWARSARRLLRELARAGSADASEHVQPDKLLDLGLLRPRQ